MTDPATTSEAHQLVAAVRAAAASHRTTWEAMVPNMFEVNLALEPVEDDFELLTLVEEHSVRTGSAVAELLLRDWIRARSAFVQVMPHDYKSALRDNPVSSAGSGFLTRETEEAA